MLVLTTVQNKKFEDELVPLRSNYASELKRTERLNAENENLRTLLEKRPNQYIKVEKEICTKLTEGAVAEEKIRIAPATKNVEVGNEKGFADVDAPFEPDFLRLLE